MWSWFRWVLAENWNRFLPDSVSTSTAKNQLQKFQNQDVGEENQRTGCEDGAYLPMLQLWNQVRRHLPRTGIQNLLGTENGNRTPLLLLWRLWEILCSWKRTTCPWEQSRLLQRRTSRIDGILSRPPQAGHLCSLFLWDDSPLQTYETGNRDAYEPRTHLRRGRSCLPQSKGCCSWVEWRTPRWKEQAPQEIFQAGIQSCNKRRKNLRRVADTRHTGVVLKKTTRNNKKRRLKVSNFFYAFLMWKGFCMGLAKNWNRFYPYWLLVSTALQKFQNQDVCE